MIIDSHSLAFPPTTSKSRLREKNEFNISVTFDSTTRQIVVLFPSMMVIGVSLANRNSTTDE